MGEQSGTLTTPTCFTAVGLQQASTIVAPLMIKISRLANFSFFETAAVLTVSNAPAMHGVPSLTADLSLMGSIVPSLASPPTRFDQIAKI